MIILGRIRSNRDGAMEVKVSPKEFASVVLKRILYQMEKYGWRKGDFGVEGGPQCLMGHYCSAYRYVVAKRHLYARDRALAYRLIEAETSLGPIIYNDMPSTTKSNVKKVVKDALTKTERRRKSRNG